MNFKRKIFFYVLSCLLILAYLGFEVWGVEPEPIEGRITRLNEKRGTLSINDQELDASDFELSDLKVGYWIMGQFIRDKAKLRLIDLEVIK